MLEKIGTTGFETLSRPDNVTLEALDKVLERNADPVVFEIGVGIGATTIEIARRLHGKGQIVLFSRENDVRELTQDLNAMGYENVIGVGSPGKIYSGYHFDMAKAFLAGRLPQFDLSFLDGGHTMHLDGSTTCLLKELAKDGAHLVFDDVSWSLATSPTLNPLVRERTRQEYDDEQIDACQVDMVLRCFMDTDPRFQCISKRAGSAHYRKRPFA